MPEHGRHERAYVLHVCRGLPEQRGARLGREDERLRPARAGAEADVVTHLGGHALRALLRARRPAERHGERHGRVRHGNPGHERLERPHVVRVDDPRDGPDLGARRAPGDLPLFLLRRVVDVDLEQEAIELGLGKRVRPLLLDGVTRGEDLEGIGERVGGRAHGDATLLHGLEERSLRLRRRAVDLVGQDEVVKDGPGQEAHAPADGTVGLFLLLEHVRPRDVGGEQVRGELHAAEAQVEGLREGCDEERLGEPRDTHEEGVPAGEQRHEHELDDRLLTHDTRPDGVVQSAAGSGGLLEQRSVSLRRWGRRRRWWRGRRARDRAVRCVVGGLGGHGRGGSTAVRRRCAGSPMSHARARVSKAEQRHGACSSLSA